MVLKTWHKFSQPKETKTQHTERDLSKIEKNFNRTFMGWKSMLQGFRIYFVWYPREQLFETVKFAFMKIFDFLIKTALFGAFLLF